MSDQFLGEIRVFAGNFAPKGWAFCNGQLLPISQNTALFSILGTQYGGDGKVTFALPNLQGTAPMCQGAGAGLTPRSMGELVGSENVTLLTTEIPSHTHQAKAIAGAGNATDPSNHYWAETPFEGRHPVQTPLYAPTPDQTLSPAALSASGGSQPHNNMQPYLALNFIIAMEGIFPPRG
ncbi:phage tail protein [Tumebacillus sp. ITR2]|uniref:Phage tail protein n=1 Tax=Tumebacillus amylolyticus TaxID=2801339 RepID=A0ABS1J8F5_9BACL|nr:tail fiber protein [Tumebacillus amylolyticus]MBL0386545.1 phage tail protein [Tumebacillus amylolyticus]